MKKCIIFTFFVLIITLCNSVFAQTTYNYSINWSYSKSNNLLSFENAAYLIDSTSLPVYMENITLNSEEVCKEMSIKNISGTRCTDKNICDNVYDEDVIFDWSFGLTGDSSVCGFILYPYYIDSKSGECIMVTSFDIVVTTEKRSKPNRELPSRSVLSKGDWYRFKVLSEGVYCLTYEDLLDNNVDVKGLKSDNIRIFANKGYFLPESNSKAILDNAPEIPIIIKDGGDGTFDKGDSILFYLEGPHSWEYDKSKYLYSHQYNHYSETAFFLLNISSEKGKRISVFDNSNFINSKKTITNYTKLDFYQNPLINILNSGNLWFGEEFDDTELFIVPKMFSVPELAADDENSSSHIVYRIMCVSSGTNYVNAIVNGQHYNVQSISRVSGNYVGREKIFNHSINLNNPNIEVKFQYSSNSAGGKAYLGYVNLNLRSKLKYPGDQFTFRDPYFYSEPDGVKYVLTNSSVGINVWNITDKLNPIDISLNHSNDTTLFYYNTQSQDLPEEFVAFYYKDLKNPIFDRKIANQDLFSTSHVDNIYIVPEGKFIEQAEMFGQLHKEKSGSSYLVVELDKIYNEFSCGALDLSAIRNFIRHIYLSSGKTYPKNVLLFGTTSFDYKNILAVEPNLMPTYESYESLESSRSYGTDDYYVLMDEDEGAECKGYIDIPIGRIPFNNEIDIEGYFQKVKHYYESKSSSDGTWKSRFVGVADDGHTRADSESNVYPMYMEKIDTIINSYNQHFMFNKVYIDAFEHVSSSSGYTTPDATDYLINSFNEGALIVAYYGHGSKLGWAGENLLTVPSIQRINNIDNMPLVVAATCDYFGFDQLNLYPSAKHLIQSPKGGAVSLISTSRTSYATICYNLFGKIIELLRYPTINGGLTAGEIFLAGKQNVELLFKSIHLFGDPAMKINYPEYNIEVELINQNSIIDSITFKNSELVNVTGRIILEKDFNGFLSYELYDQPTKYRTLGHEYSTPMNFYIRDKIISKGVVSIENNEFDITFRLPNNLNAGDSTLKLQLYAYDTINNITAIGSVSSINFKGESDDYSDTSGPRVTAYINHPYFENYDIIGKDANLYIYLFDESGIDFYGNSIGKQISYILNEDYSSFDILNSYFVLENDDYQRGYIEYELTDLPLGDNYITIDVYDVMGNLTQKTLYFTVAENIKPKLIDVYVSPNPVNNNHTEFYITHNIINSDFDVMIDVYDISGNKKTQLKQKISATTSNQLNIPWNCTNNNGTKLSSGIYIYVVTIYADDVRKAICSDKIFIE
ncbi:MAG: type IX secretion system sortase PorU [Bacteroidales bacterium]|jgi:hypothetical protein|nr:type IX secretion system sortase PorU [Bacteroidales bacterium]